MGMLHLCIRVHTLYLNLHGTRLYTFNLNFLPPLYVELDAVQF